MLLYLIKSSICLFLLLGFYLLVLEREKMHRFNRFYLLGSLVFSLLIPFYMITISVPVAAESMNFVPQSEFATTNPELLSIPLEITKKPFNYTPYLIALYALISVILSFRFGKNLLQLWRKIAKNQHVHYLMATVVLLKEKVLPHTFWNYIFIDKKEYTSKKLDAQVLTHELAHVEQKHTLDVLFIEILRLIFWFNPIFSWYKKVIQLNHEFLADDAVISAHKNLTAYQHVLLNLSSQQQTTYLTSNLNYSLTKKRIIMMTTPSSRSKILLKKLAIVPLLAGFTFLFAHKVEAQEIKSGPSTTSYKVEKQETKKLQTSNNNPVTLDEYYAGVKFLRYQKGLIYTDTILGKELILNKRYEDLTKKEKNRFVLLIPKPLRKKLPTKAELQEFQNSKKYAIWIDGKNVPNTELKKYKPADFAYFGGRMTISKSGRTKKHPQPFWGTFYTPKYFDKMEFGVQKRKYLGDRIISYDSTVKMHKYFNAQNQRQAAKTIYISKTKQEGLSKEEMAEYKRLFNSGKQTKVYKQKDINRMMTLYKKMSKEQQSSVTDIKKIMLPPPPPIHKKTPSTAQLNSWKNSDRFALWIDGKVVENKVLNNYKNTDFYSYSGSFVYKNARSKRFPQEYQFSLYTKPYFTKMLAKQKKEKLANTLVIYMNKTGKLLVNNDATATQNLRNTLDKFIKEDKPFTVAVIADKKTKREDIKELIHILKKLKVKNYYVNFKVLPPPPPPRKTKNQEKVTFHKNWYITIDGQKYYYTFDKNERIARYYNANGKFVNLDIKKEYIKKNTLFEKLKNTGVHYVFKPKAEKATIEQLFSDLGGMYFRMSRADKNNVPFPKNPNGAYVQIVRKDGSTYYKKRTALTAADKKLLPPPPPPRPNATKDEVKRYKEEYKKFKNEYKRYLKNWKNNRTNYPPPPPPPTKNATKKEIERYKIANANWKKSLKDIPTPPVPPSPPKPQTPPKPIKTSSN